jgi:hypothetical protein
VAKNTIYPLTNVVYNILASSFSLSWAACETACKLWAGHRVASYLIYLLMISF